jgi:hypothetical protein
MPPENIPPPLAHIKKKTMRTIIVFAIISIYSCSSNSHWIDYWAKGLPNSGEYYEDLIFINDSIGFLGGSNLRGDKFDKAILYKTTDKGLTWNSISLNYKGSVKKIFFFNDTIILQLQDIMSDTNYIVRTEDDGKKWENIYKYGKGSYIGSIKFFNSTKGYFIIDNHKEQYLVHYSEIRLDTILSISSKYFYHTIFQDSIISLISDGLSANSKGVLITNIQTNKTREILFDKPYHIASISNYKNNLFLAAQDKDYGKILKLTDNKFEVIELGKSNNFTPVDIFVNDSKMIVIAQKEKAATVLGATHDFLISLDNGKNWEIEKLPYPLTYSPAFLYNDKFFISSAGIGQFQIRE